VGLDVDVLNRILQQLFFSVIIHFVRVGGVGPNRIPPFDNGTAKITVGEGKSSDYPIN
jgi:hypothetical protein